MSGTGGLHLDLVRWCATCRDEVFFEQPDCLDDHGVDCPERVCVQCGEAFLVGFAVPTAAPAGASRRRAGAA
jgi:hypothetical protein